MSFTTRFFIIFTLGFASACNSPLLHHVEADELIRSPTLEKTTECTLLFPQQQLCASWTWRNFPKDEDFGAATIRFWNRDQDSSIGAPLDSGLTVNVKLWMPAMGHGSSPVTVQVARDASGSVIPGTFEASKIFFSMPGEWEIRVQLKRDGQVMEQAKFSVSL